MGDMGLTEILIIVGILVLFFGARKIPELARGIGQGITEFKNATEGELEDNNNEKKQHSDSHKEVKEQSKV